MSRLLWHLPWNGARVPHAVLDILRGCNMSCRACYNSARSHTKSIDEVREELDELTARRRLASVSILGGEPTLHPQLCDIIRMIKARRLSVELFTNGLLLDTAFASRLRDAGVDLLFVHIDPHQSRADLGEGANESDFQRLRAELCATAAATGMEVGLAITAYANALMDINEAVRFVLTSAHVDYLVATLHRDMVQLGPIVGNIDAGMRGQPNPADAPLKHDTLTNDAVRTRLRDVFGLQPFAYVGSNVDAADRRWLSYLIAVLATEDRPLESVDLKATVAEKLFLFAHWILRGRYPFFVQHNARRFWVQLLLNSLFSGMPARHWKLLVRSLTNGAHLRSKRLLFQCPAELLPDGTVVHCRDCPDATIRNGRIVPVCISDNFTGIVTTTMPRQRPPSP